MVSQGAHGCSGRRSFCTLRGSDEDFNKHLVCAACHIAITEGRLKVSGRAPDGLTWEGPFGVIEKPLPLDRKPQDTSSNTNEEKDATTSTDAEVDAEETKIDELFVREPGAEYEAISSHVIHGSDISTPVTYNVIQEGRDTKFPVGSTEREPGESLLSVPSG
jgi:hypothetical protein